MSEALENLLANCREALGETVLVAHIAHGELTIEIPPEQVLGAGRLLRDHPRLAFEQLVDLCGVDYLAYGVAQADTAGQPPHEMAGDASVPVDSTDTDTGHAMERPPRSRFAVVYHLLSIKHNHRIRVRVWLDDAMPLLPSFVELWASANWFEREAFDLFGIIFDGHPDLRRLLTDYGFIGYPFRKDFPLSGQVEMRYDEEKQRVVYQPVTIEPRILVPRVIRQEGFGGRNP
jgi:NADH-quinone oxidoreductase subunit C